MKTKAFIAILLCCLCGSAWTQTLEGRVTDERSQPLEFVNVVLYSLPDTAQITGTITDADGNFSLTSEKVSNGFIEVSFAGYLTQRVGLRQGQTIVLQPDTALLGEAVISAVVPKIKIRNDALVATVENSVLKEAGTANEVLKRLPSVTGNDGDYSVFGKGKAVIYINNREVRDPSELDKLNSADIRDVEIITNPGARYDASVKAVIRINTIRKAGDGFGFDLRSSYYQSENVDLVEQLNLNYRKNGWDIFGTMAYYQNEFLQKSNVLQKTYVDTLWLQNNDFTTENHTKTIEAIAGINYEISPKHYVGARYTLSASPNGKMITNTKSRIYAGDTGNVYDELTSVTDDFSARKPSHRINAYYDGTVDRLNINFNTDFYTDNQSSRSTITETSLKYSDKTVTSENDVDNRLVAAKLILSYPVFGGSLSLGSEYTDTYRRDKYVNRENTLLSLNTTIEERNASLFAEYSYALPFGQLGAGLRYENVQSDYFVDDKRADEQSRRYSQWFPNASFATNIGNISLQLSYTAKNRRPTYRELSNNTFYMNRLTMQRGNPLLKPTLMQDITLIGSWKFMQAMISYKEERNAILHWTEQDKDTPKISIVSFRNFDRLPRLTALLAVAPSFGIWTPQTSVGFQKQWITIDINNKKINLNTPVFLFSMKNSISLPKGFLFTLDMNFQSKGDYQNVYLAKNKFIVNTGITKSFFDKRLRVELKAHDLFRAVESNLLYNEKMELIQTNTFDNREIELTLRYNFNTAKSKYKGTGAGNSEKERL